MHIYLMDSESHWPLPVFNGRLLTHLKSGHRYQGKHIA
jgi:hypothetical protein